MAKKENKFMNLFHGIGGAFFALVLMTAVLCVFTGTFATRLNFVNLLKQITCNSLLSFGLTCCLITGFPDLSVGSHVALAMQNVLRGIAYVLTNGGAVVVANDTGRKFFNLSNASIGGWVPYSTLILVIAFVVINTLLKRTVFGRHMYAVGGNSSTAVYSGIDVKNIRLIVFTISGFLAAMAGILTASRVYSGQPTTGIGFEGEAIASAVLGGISFTGGIGTLSGSLIGILIMGVMSNGMNLLQINYYWQLVVKGVIILVAVYADQVKRSKTK